MKNLYHYFRTPLSFFCLLSIFLGSGCAYYNTLFNAKLKYHAGLQILKENAETTDKVPDQARSHFEQTIDKCWKLIEIYSDKNSYADDALLYIAKSEFQLQKYPQARLHLKQFFGKYPQSNLLYEAYLWYAKLLLKEDNLDSAREYLLRITNNPQTTEKIRAQADLELGLYAFEKENYEQTIHYLSKALKEDLEDEFKALLYYHLGEAYFHQQKYKKAIQCFRKIENYSPTVDVEYKTKHQLSFAYIETGNFEESHYVLRKMLTAPRFDAYRSKIKSTIARNYLQQQRLEEAVEMYTDVVMEKKKDVGTAQAAFDLAQVYEKYYNNIDSAVVYYGQVEALSKDFEKLDFANKQKLFLGEYKSLRDAVKKDTRLVYRLKNDVYFRDSLYQAQRIDSLIQIGELEPEKQYAAADSLISAEDSIKTAQQTLTDKNVKNEAVIAASTSSAKDAAVKTQPATPSEDLKPEPLEKRKLSQIESELLENQFHLAEYFLLKVENYDSALVFYKRFLDRYDDPLLTPKALYSLRYIYSSPGFVDSRKVTEYEKTLLRKYPGSVFAKEILKNKGLYGEETDWEDKQKAQKLFLEAESFYLSGNHEAALERYKKVAQANYTWEIAAKAQLVIAWMYEHQFKNTQLARAAYQEIVDKYPTAQEYVTLAREKIIPVSGDESFTEAPGHSESSGESKKIEEKLPEEKPEELWKIATEDVLREKILWRRQRDGEL